MPVGLTKRTFSRATLCLLVLAAVNAAFAQVSQPPAPAGPPKDAAKDVGAWEKPVAMCWSFSAEILLNVPIVSNANFLFVPLGNGGVSAVDAASGKQTWHADLGGEIEGLKHIATAVDSGRLIAVTRQEGEDKDKKSLVVHLLSDASGITVWRKELENSAAAYLKASGPLVFLARDNGAITAFQAADGEIAWQTSAGGAITTAPAMNDKSMFAGVAGKKIVEISLETGKIVQEFAAAGEPSGPMMFAGDALIYSDLIGSIYALRTADREPLWKARAGAQITNISTTDFGVLVTSNDNFAYMLAAGRGDRKWKSKFGGRLVGKPVLNEKYGLFITASGRGASILNLSNGKFANGISLLDEAFIVGDSTGTARGFSLLTSDGLMFYSPEGCAAKK